MVRRAAQGAAAAFCVLLAAACSSDNQHGRIDLAGHQASGDAANAQSVQVALDLAEHERAAGNYQGAVALYRRALEIAPGQHQALLGLGYALLDAGSPNEAADIFHTLLDKPPADPRAEAGFGETLLALDQPAAAVERLRKAIAAAPDARAYRSLCVAEDLLGQFPQAIADCQSGLGLMPDDAGLRDDLGLSQALAGDYDAAIANLRAAASVPGAAPRLRLNLALGLGLAGRMADAERVARVDLDEKSVQSNLAYYSLLRGLPPKDRAEALLRPGAPPPLTQPAVVK